MEKKTKVGPNGKVVIPKDIRNKIGIKENSEVIVDILDDSIIIRKLKPESVSYVDFYCTTYSRKLKMKVDIKKSLRSSMKGIYDIDSDVFLYPVLCENIEKTETAGKILAPIERKDYMLYLNVDRE